MFVPATRPCKTVLCGAAKDARQARKHANIRKEEMRTPEIKKTSTERNQCNDNSGKQKTKMAVPQHQRGEVCVWVCKASS